MGAAFILRALLWMEEILDDVRSINYEDGQDF